MKKMIKFLSMILCFCCLAGVLSGCGSSDNANISEENPNSFDNTTPVHVALVLQSVATVPVVNVSAADELIKDVCSIPGSSISIIVADGKPWEYASVELEEIDHSLSKEMQQQILKERVQELTAIATTAVATNPESDLRGAIELAARHLQTYEDGQKELIIFGSGINTVEPLKMQNMILSNMDVDAVIKNLTDQFCIVDLENINVTVFNLGDTCGEEQKTLTNQDKAKLKSFWNTFLEAGNPIHVTFKTNLPTGLIYENLPYMSAVPVVENRTALEASTVEEIAQATAISFDEKSIAFQKGKATLANSEAALEAISAVAEYMISSKTEAMLIGCTARWGELSESINLSYERAKVIKSLFVKAGVDENQLTVIGTGWLSCFYQNDNTANGELDETIAPSNRTCVWLNKSSELTKMVLNDSDFQNFIVEE